MEYLSVLLILAVVISLFASLKVNLTFSKYNKVRSMSGKTAEEVARDILNNNGLFHVRIEKVAGKLRDHYDPRSEVLRLSDSTYGKSSVAAIGVAAHECGHAIQHAERYAPLVTRNTFAPVAQFSSHLSFIFIIAGLWFEMTGMLGIGIVLFSAIVLFQLITLPVEFDASMRASRILAGCSYLSAEENRSSNKVLRAAAMTYVASTIVSILQLIRLILIFSRRR